MLSAKCAWVETFSRAIVSQHEGGYFKYVLRGGCKELKWCQYKLVRPTKLKTWILTVLGLKFMGFLADLKNFHFEALGVLSKSGGTSKNHDFG